MRLGGRFGSGHALSRHGGLETLGPVQGAQRLVINCLRSPVHGTFPALANCASHAEKRPFASDADCANITVTSGTHDVHMGALWIRRGCFEQEQRVVGLRTR